MPRRYIASFSIKVEKLFHGHLESRGYLFQILKLRSVEPALNIADRFNRQTGFVGQLLLGNARLPSQVLKSFPKLFLELSHGAPFDSRAHRIEVELRV